MRARALLFCVFLGGCGAGKSVVDVTVTATGAVVNTDRLRVTVTNANQTAPAVEFRLPGAPVTIPPPQTVALVFDKDRSGDTVFVVDALDANGHRLATGMSHGNVEPSQTTSVMVTLGGVAMPDMAGVDAVMSPDLAILDSSMPDFAKPDLSTFDLSMPDLPARAAARLPRRSITRRVWTLNQSRWETSTATASPTWPSPT